MQDGALLVRGMAAGVCGTDRELAKGAYGTPPSGEARLVIGHESLGEVLEAPTGSGFAPGDLVVGIVRRPDPMPCLLGAQRGYEMHVVDLARAGPKRDLVEDLGARYHSGQPCCGLAGLPQPASQRPAGSESPRRCGEVPGWGPPRYCQSMGAWPQSPVERRHSSPESPRSPPLP